MKQTKIVEYLLKWHMDVYEKLDILTVELLDDEGADKARAQEEYARWHRASMMSPEAKEFYDSSTADEKIEAQQRLSEGDLCANPYTLMQRLNLHILYARYGTIVDGELKALREVVDGDTWDGESEVQQHITILRDSSADFKDDTNNVAMQLTEEADRLDMDAEEALETINQLLKQ